MSSGDRYRKEISLTPKAKRLLNCCRVFPIRLTSKVCAELSLLNYGLSTLAKCHRVIRVDDQDP